MINIPDPGLDRCRNARTFPTNYKPARSFDAIAIAMGTTKATVYHIYARALRKIRRELRRHPDRYFAMVR
jgi:hypothetical protein